MCLLIAAILLLVVVCVLSGTLCFNHYDFIFYFFPQSLGCAQLFFNLNIASCAFCRFGLLDLCSVKSFSFSFSHDRKFFSGYTTLGRPSQQPLKTSNVLFGFLVTLKVFTEKSALILKDFFLYLQLQFFPFQFSVHFIFSVYLVL